VAATGAKISNFEGLATLTFWPLNHVMGFPHFQLAMPISSRVRVRNGTDRHNGHHCIMPHPWGQKHNKITDQRVTFPHDERTACLRLWCSGAEWTQMTRNWFVWHGFGFPNRYAISSNLSTCPTAVGSSPYIAAKSLTGDAWSLKTYLTISTRIVQTSAKAGHLVHIQSWTPLHFREF